MSNKGRGNRQRKNDLRYMRKIERGIKRLGCMRVKKVGFKEANMPRRIKFGIDGIKAPISFVSGRIAVENTRYRFGFKFISPSDTKKGKKASATKNLKVECDKESHTEIYGEVWEWVSG